MMSATTYNSTLGFFASNSMEFLSISPLLAIFFTLTCIIFVYNKRKKTDGTAKLPPGSMGWPIIGETLEFLFGDHDKFVGDRMMKYSPHIFKTRILGKPTVVFCGPEANRFLFANEQKLVTFSFPDSFKKLMTSYQTTAPSIIPREAQVKILLSPGFLKPEALVRYLPKMDSITQQHLMYWEGKDEVKVLPLSKKLSMAMTCHSLLGTDDPDYITDLVSKFDDITIGIHSMPVNFPGTIFYRAKKSVDVVRKVLQRTIKEKKAALSMGGSVHDLLSQMMVAKDPNTGHQLLQDTEITDHILGLIVGSYNTVATVMTFLMKYVGERPDIFKKVLTEQFEIMKSKKPGEALDWDDLQRMKYSWNVVQEVMRLSPPSQGGFREAMTDFAYEGYTIPKGWKIYWTFSSTNKNPEYFADPERFDPLRYEGNGPAPYTHVPFGRGPRMCKGSEYSRLTILTFLHNVVKKFRWEMVSPNEKITSCGFPTPAQGLPIRLRQHHHEN